MPKRTDSAQTPTIGFDHIQWVGSADTGHLRLLDQTRLPATETYIDCDTVQSVWEAIRRLSVRGAPAIGIAAAYGCVIAGQQGADALTKACEYLATSRPTAVNLFWAIERMQRVVPATPEALLAVAKRIHDEDAQMCEAIGQHGMRLIDQMPIQSRGVLTHCNAGALATGGVGTATAPMYLAHQQGLPFRVYACETRPLLQGARLTSYELMRAGIDVTLICDSMAAQVMRDRRLGLVITGADRIAANGDVANKIGTYNHAVLAKHHGVPFVVAAPSSTFDLNCPSGEQIPIEERDGAEITHGFGTTIAPQGVETYSPAFDVTPAELVSAIITEHGIIQPVNKKTVADMVG